MERITLVCTSLNPDEFLLNKMLDSAEIFDDIIIHKDKHSIEFLNHYDEDGIETPKHIEIGEAYNKIIKLVETEWVCCFCDDDYFYEDGLREMISEVHIGIDADVAHFNFRISGYRPPQDKRAWLFGNEYVLGEKKPITYDLLKKHNRLPAGSFFRKSAWEKVGGFQGDSMHDWDLWKRMAQENLKFKYFPHLVYNHVRRENSAWCRQQEK